MTKAIVVKQRKTMNKPLLLKIQKTFKTKPTKAEMSSWVDIADYDKTSDYADAYKRRNVVPFCHTHMCIGGAALILSGTATLKIERDNSGGFGGATLVYTKNHKQRVQNVGDVAAAILGLTQDQRTRLFNKGNWPYHALVAEYPNLFTETGASGEKWQKHEAKQMVARIDYLLKTGV